MKISKTFVIVLSGVILLAFLLMLQMPRHYNWNVNYNVNSREPFGTKLFDSLMRASLPNGYEITTDDIDEYLRTRLSTEGEIQENILIIDEQTQISQVTDSLLYSFALRGGKVVIACSRIYTNKYSNTIRQEQEYKNEPREDTDQDEEQDESEDSISIEDSTDIKYVMDDNYESTPEVDEEIGGPLHFYFAQTAEHMQDVQSGFFDISIARANINFRTMKGLVPVTLLANAPYTSPTKIRLLQQFVPATFPFTNNDSTTCSDSFRYDEYVFQSANGSTPHIVNEGQMYNDSVFSKKFSTAITFHFGKGSICVSLAGLYFSNYGAIDNDGRTYLMHLLTPVSDKRIVRILSDRQYSATADSEDELSMFSYFFASPPLAMALRLAIIAALLALFVNARRRQRAIPLPTRQHNATLHFLRQVAALYRPTDDYTNLLAMRYKAFADKIRRRTGADILDIDDNKRREAAKIVAVHTGEDFDYAHNALRELHFNLSHERAISLRTFRKLVDIMNRIQQKL